jgi:hypothetical protein
MKYDVILLSNVADYAHLIYPGEDHLREFAGHIIHPLTKHLSINGLICAACLFQIDTQTPDQVKNDIYIARKRREFLRAIGLEYQEILFPSAISGYKDGLIVLKKTV